MITREHRDELRRRYGNHKMRRLVNLLVRDQPGGDQVMGLLELMHSQLADCCRHQSDADRFIDAAESVRDAIAEVAIENLSDKNS